MSGRDAILGRIRKSLGTAGEDGSRAATVATRLSEAPKGIVPKRGQLPKGEQVDLFRKMAETFGASVVRVAGYDEVAGEVTTYLRAKNLPASIRIGDDKRLAKAGWTTEKTLDVRRGPSDGTDLAGVSHAFSAIAETGTLALVSGSDNPTTINFLPEHHIVVIKATDVKGDLEAVWAMLRKKTGKGEMPRTVNLITGPSRSGDIEQTIILGAHGPRALHVIIVDE